MHGRPLAQFAALPCRPARAAWLAALVGAVAAAALSAVAAEPQAESRFTRLEFRQPGLVVPVGVGLWAWPLPMDHDGDGDLDLVVSCPDKPYHGVWLFENPAAAGAPADPWPVFRPARRLGAGLGNAQVSYVDGVPRVLVPGFEIDQPRGGDWSQRTKIYPTTNLHPRKVRANQWRYADYDGDGRLDLVVGTEDWTDYGWDNAYDRQGRWTNGPLRGWVYWVRNEGTTDRPQYAAPVRLEAGGQPLETFGMPSPSLADFDGDGDLDLLCGEFLDGFTYFENVGTRTAPRLAAGRRALDAEGRSLAMHVQMITPVALDWDADGHVDLVVGDEDGGVALVRHVGRVVDGLPRFEPPRYFEQAAREVKFGALAAPTAVDWDADGDEDLLVGNTAGEVGFLENLGGGVPPRFAAPRLVEADGRPIHIQAGPNGSIQGPAEAKWGYTTLSAADWDHDGRVDLVVNSIWGKVVWYRNEGSPGQPRLAAARPVEVAWDGPTPKPAWTWWEPEGKELCTQWRTTPVVVDWNDDGLNDLVMLDHEGYLALFERRRSGDGLVLLPGRRVFVDAAGQPLLLAKGVAGRSGRRKLTLADWDGDGRRDLLIDGRNADFYRNEGPGPDGTVKLVSRGPVDPLQLAGHDTAPTTVDWDDDGRRDLVLGAEDGHFYYLPNPGPAATAK